jgi:Zn-dependent M28 family amino/carboxypeptidase
MGLRPEVQTTTVVNHTGTPLIAGTVHNIVARLQGTEQSKALLLVAHYDSVPTGPGASDDGAAVAAMLETLRALKASTPLRNDVI